MERWGSTAAADKFGVEIMKNWQHHAFTAFVGTVLGAVACGIVITHKQLEWDIDIDIYGHPIKTKLVGIQCLPFYPVEWLASSLVAAFCFHLFEEVIEEVEKAKDN